MRRHTTAAPSPWLDHGAQRWLGCSLGRRARLRRLPEPQPRSASQSLPPSPAAPRNSLAATDEPLVHSAYRRYRDEMLRRGVELYELTPLRLPLALGGGVQGEALGRLHAKTRLAADRERVGHREWRRRFSPSQPDGVRWKVF